MNTINKLKDQTTPQNKDISNVAFEISHYVCLVVNNELLKFAFFDLDVQ